jgi:hypothetical protein
MAGPEAYVGAPWVDMVGPQVGGPWLDMVGPQVGGPWLDMVGPEDNIGPYVGGPWVDLVGAYDEAARRRAWPQTRALIELAKREAIDAQAAAPAAAWVWSLDPPGLSARPGVELMPTSQLTPFSSVAQAQAYMFERIQTPHVALALFDTADRRHWPHPVRWTSSDDPAYESLIAQHVARFAPTHAVGNYGGYVGACPSTAIGAALDDVKDRARSLASKRAGRVIGVIHTTKDNLWHAYGFGTQDDADDWLEANTKDQAAYTYAAFFDKADATWPNAVIEKIGGTATPPVRRGRGTQRDWVGAAFADARKHAQALATAKAGNAVGVIHTIDGLWHSFGFHTLDDSVDWLQAVTRDRATFTYAAIYDKGADGTAYTQGEEFGGGREVAPPGPLIRRGPGTISGRWAA